MSSFLARRVFSAPRILRAFSTTPARPLAKITIIGHLADTPELQPTSTGNDIVKYSVASSSGPATNRHTSWWRVAAFEGEGPRRDFLLSLPKGALVYVDGDVSTTQWEDAEGTQRSGLRIVQQKLEVLRRPQSQAGSSEGQASGAAA